MTRTCTLFVGLLETNSFMMIYAMDSVLSNKTKYPSIINLNVSPDSAYFRAFHAMALRYGWSQAVFVCMPEPENITASMPHFPMGVCSQVDQIVAALPPRPYTMDRLFLFADPDNEGSLDYESVLDDKLLRSSRRKSAALSFQFHFFLWINFTFKLYITRCSHANALLLSLFSNFTPVIVRRSTHIHGEFQFHWYLLSS